MYALFTFFLILALRTGMTGAIVFQENDDKSALLARIDAWQAWDDSFEQWNVTIEESSPSSDEPGAVNQRQVQRNKRLDLYCMSLKHRRSQDKPVDHYVSIANPDYLAELRKGQNGQWAVESLTLRDTPEFPERRGTMLYGTDYFAKLRHPGEFRDLLLGKEHYTVTSIDQLHDRIVYNLQFSPGVSERDARFNLSTMSLHFSTGELAPPLRIDYARANANVSWDFSDWSSADGAQVPVEVGFYVPQFSAEGVTPHVTYKLSYNDMSDRIDPAACRLPFYGIPEPGGGDDGFRIQWWYLVVLGLIIAWTGVVLMRRRTQ